MRVITFTFSGMDDEIQAELHDDEQPDFTNRLWDDLEEPLKMWTWHTTASGDYFSAKGRPDKHPVSLGSQAAPLQGATLMCDVPTGSIMYSGKRVLSFAYGPDVTEPLPCTGPVVAHVRNPELMFKAGRRVWDSHYRTHELVTLTVKRAEEE
jgi:hypothetical protein